MIQRVFKSIGARLTFVVAIMLAGFIVIAGTGVTVFTQIEQAVSKRVLLLEQARVLQSFRISLLESIILVDRLILEQNESIVPQLLALNEDSLGFFGRYQSNAELFDLRHDQYAAAEHESLVFKARASVFEIVSQYRAGNKLRAATLRMELLSEQLKPVITFIENAAELRRFDIEDETARVEELKQYAAMVVPAIFIIVVILTSILARLVHQSITGPLAGLNRAIEKYDPADQPDNILSLMKPGSEDEISSLLFSFRQMSELLRKHEKDQAIFVAEIQQQNIELERFNYTVSHDLKTPLVTIKGFTGILKEDMHGGDASKIRYDIEKIEAAADHMATLLSELLELSRAGRIINEPEKMSLTQLCENVIETMSVAIQERSAEIIIAPDMPEIYGDRLRLREVMQNLFENSLKFSREDSTPTIEVSASLQSDNVEVQVRDNGIGIDPSYHELIFQLFERLDATIPGTGIGLALTKRIIEVHGGQVWVEPQVDEEGCCFCFTLPVKNESLDSVANQ